MYAIGLVILGLKFSSLATDSNTDPPEDELCCVIELSIMYSYTQSPLLRTKLGIKEALRPGDQFLLPMAEVLHVVEGEKGLSCDVYSKIRRRSLKVKLFAIPVERSCLKSEKRSKISRKVCFFYSVPLPLRQ